MAGIFGLFDFTKEGKGVKANEPRGPWYIRIFQNFGRSYSKILLSNLIYMLVAGVVLAFMLCFILPSMVSTAADVDINEVFTYYTSIEMTDAGWYDEVTKNMTAEEIAKLDKTVTVTMAFRYLAVLVVMLPILTFGCAYSGLCYNTRNAARDTHIFVWSDFWDAFKRNWKQTLAMTFINLFACIVFSICFWFYFSYDGLPSMLSSMGAVVLSIVFVIFLMMNMYIYPQIVTFDFKLKTIIRNSFSLSMLRFFPNLFTLAAIFLLAYGICWINDVFVIMFIVLMGPGFCSYLMNFTAWSAMEKYVVVQDEKSLNQGALFED
ncbi:MAG: DUF624 domain-containing protein [Clostridia bacterium]|nr:DUF624 domain-containing protein [Clostridia bacterium]